MFDLMHEEGLLRRDEVESLRYHFQDLIDRLYQNDTEIDCDELDNSISKIANILELNTPKVELSVKMGDSFFEYVEDKLMQIQDMSYVYLVYPCPHKAIEWILIRESGLLSVGLSESDIVKFCNSEFFLKKVGLSCQDSFFEYVERTIRENICEIEFIYTQKGPDSTSTFLKLSLNHGLKGLLTEHDINSFCYSEFYKKKSQEAKNVL